MYSLCLWIEYLLMFKLRRRCDNMYSRNNDFVRMQSVYIIKFIKNLIILILVIDFVIGVIVHYRWTIAR